MKPETVKLYEKRFEEEYDVENDELYSIWSRKKKLTISDPPANRQDKEVASGMEQEKIPRTQQKVSCALDEVLIHTPIPLLTKRRKVHFINTSSQQLIVYMEKKAAKQREKEEKQHRKREVGT